VLGEDEQMTRRYGLRAMLTGVSALLALTGCGGGSDEPNPPPSSAPPPVASAAPTPAASGCHVLTYDQALAATLPEQEKTVPCTRQHTSQTYAVGELDTAVDGHLLAVDSDRVRAQLAQRCPAALGAYLGGDGDKLRLSVLRATWFRPTVDEAAHGADWYRCDVIALAGDGELASLTTSLRGILSSSHAGDWALCGTAQPGAAGFQRVPCGQRHTWKALATVALPQGGYPGEAAVKNAGDGPCKTAGRAAASDALNYQWAYEWPTAEQWRTGQQYGICWAPSKG
jgi:hypothetical protein